MTDLSQCYTCNGRKKLYPLGSIEKECHTCKGIGFIQTTSTIVTNTLELSPSAPEVITIEPVINPSIESLKDKLMGNTRAGKGKKRPGVR